MPSDERQSDGQAPARAALLDSKVLIDRLGLVEQHVLPFTGKDTISA